MASYPKLHADNAIFQVSYVILSSKGEKCIQNFGRKITTKIDISSLRMKNTWEIFTVRLYRF